MMTIQEAQQEYKKLPDNPKNRFQKYRKYPSWPGRGGRPPYANIPHATVSGYEYHKCRCEECRRFYKEYSHERYPKTSARYTPIGRILRNAQLRERRKNDPAVKILGNLRTRIGACITKAKTGKVSPTKELLGCSIGRFMEYLSAHFKPGMSFRTYGKFTWHIDHTRPCDSFDLTDPEQQKQCFHWSNLKPMWAPDNWSKNNRILEGTV